VTLYDWQVALDRWLSDQWVLGAMLTVGVVCWVVGKMLADEPKLRKGPPPTQEPPR